MRPILARCNRALPLAEVEHSSRTLPSNPALAERAAAAAIVQPDPYVPPTEALLGPHLDKWSVARDQEYDPNDVACAARNPRSKTRAKLGYLR